MHGTTSSLLLGYTPHIGATRLNSIENTLLMFSQYRACKCASARTCPRFILFPSSLILTIFQQHNDFEEVRPRDIEIPLLQDEIALLFLFNFVEHVASCRKKKYISCVELIFIVKHNNIHPLLPHLLSVGSIARESFGENRR